ncbi:MAG: delta-60 repeat domain-containing protein [Bdellovibrionales bacterium]|nr:delta-60 repeat domain-containing protein [Bdellovibrionales bacterium]
MVLEKLSRILKFVFIAVVGAVILTSCGGDEDDGEVPVENRAAPFRPKVLIDNGNPTTTSLDVRVSLSGANVTHVYFTANSTCASGGAWISMTSGFNYRLPVANSLNTVYAKFRNGVGGPESSCLTAQILHDSSLPTVVITAPAAGTAINLGTVSAFPVSGTCSEEGRSVSIRVGAVTSTAVCSGGVFSRAVDFSSVADGSVSAEVSQTDIAGNSSAASSRAFLKDTVPPVVSIGAPAALTVMTPLTETAFVVSCSCSESGQSILLSGAAAGSAVCAAGSWSAAIDFSSASYGTVTLLADHIDAAGNYATQDSRQFIRELPPVLTIASPVSGAYVNATNQAAFVVTGTCGANGQPVLISGAAVGSATCAAGNFTAVLNLSAAAQGSLTLIANHSTVSGTAATPVSVIVMKDTSLPTVTISSPAAGSFINVVGESNFSVIGTCSENGRAVSIEAGSVSASATCSLGTFSQSLDLSSLSEGPVLVSVTQSDVAGNTSAIATRSFTKDTVAPLVTIDDPADMSTISLASEAAFTVSGSCSENGRTVVITGDVGGGAVCIAGSWTATLNFVGAPEGTVIVTVDLDDVAGNDGLPYSRNFDHEVTPILTVTDPIAGSYVAIATQVGFPIEGACGANGQNVVITGDASGTTVCSGGLWSTTLDFTAAAEGPISVTVNHSSIAGSPAVPVTIGLIKDSVAPALTITTPIPSATLEGADFSLVGGCTIGEDLHFFPGTDLEAVVSMPCNSGTYRTSWHIVGATGPRTIEVRSHDLAGNETVATRTFNAVRAVEPLGAVSAVLGLADGRRAVGGAFTGFSRTPRMGVLRYVSATDTLDATAAFGGGFNGSVFSAVALPDGSYIFGGSFTRYRDQVATNVARVLPNGQLDLTFNPSSGANGANGAVNAIATDGTSIWLAGAFTTYRGGVANRVAKISLSGVLDTTFSPSSGGNGVNATVNALALDGGVLYIGGTFATYRGATATRIAKVNAATGVLDTVFNPASGGNGVNNTVFALLADASGVWIGGQFTTYRGAAANRLARVSLTGVLDTVISPSTGGNGFNNIVRAFALSGTSLYVGGDFTTYRGGAANRIALLSAATGSIDTIFNPTSGGNGFSSGSVTALGVDTTGVIWVGGSFVAYRGATARVLARLSGAGALLSSGHVNAQANAFIVEPSTVVVAGGFKYGSPEWVANNVAIVDSAGIPDVTFSPQAGANGTNNTVNALASDGTSLYLGGTFTAYRGGLANRVAKVNLGSGAIDTVFSPISGSNGANNSVLALQLDGVGGLYLGGAFTTYRGTAANRVTKVNAMSGVKDTVFSPNTGANGAGGQVNALALVGTDLYIGGAFTAYRGAVANRIARVSAVGVMDMVFSPATGANGANNTVSALTTDGTDVYLGGAFTTYRGAVANRVARISTAGGLNVTFSPATGSNGANSTVSALAYDGTSLYVAGAFTTYRGTAANRVTKVTLSGSKDTTFSPNSGANGADATVSAISWSAGSSRLLMGGSFYNYRGVGCQFYGVLQANGAK